MQMLRDEAVNKMFRPRVLDLACGKGGDLRKWNIANVDSVVMAGQSSDRSRSRIFLFVTFLGHIICLYFYLSSLHSLNLSQN